MLSANSLLIVLVPVSKRESGIVGYNPEATWRIERDAMISIFPSWLISSTAAAVELIANEIRTQQSNFFFLTLLGMPQGGIYPLMLAT